LQNIEKARKEIDRLEAEANETQNSNPRSSGKRTQDSTKKAVMKNQLPNGTDSADTEPNEETKVVDNVAQALDEAKIDEKGEE
jgi:hypothetical protein